MEKTKKFLLIVSILITGVMLYSCSSTPSGRAKSIEEAYPDRFEKTIAGMNLNEFKEVWPEAKRSGFNEGSEVYLFVYRYVPLVVFDNGSYYIDTKFYFSEGKLTKYESIQR